MEKLFNGITAIAASTIALIMASPVLVLSGAMMLGLGCALCCGLAGFIGSINPPA